MPISVAEFLTILVCTAGMFLILAIATWILLNKRRILRSDPQNDELNELEREYAAGDIDEDEYQRRRSEILSDSR